jgi:MFS family permease
MQSGETRERVDSMKKTQIASLFVNTLCIWMVGLGLLPLLPIYAEKLTVDPAVLGYYLAFAMLTLAAGEIAAGWLSDRFQSRKIPMILAGVVATAATWLMGQVNGISSLIVLTGLVWFCGGMGLAMVSILTGLSAGKDERGKIFGILSLTAGLGAFIGGLSTGAIVDHWGYPVMFRSVAGICVFWAGTACLVNEKETVRAQKKSGPSAAPDLGKPFALLLLAVIIGAVTANMTTLLR